MSKVLVGLALVVLLALPLDMSGFSVTFPLEAVAPLRSMNPAAENPTLNLTYSTADNPVEQPVTSGSTISGDHVRLAASWTPALVSESSLEVFAEAIPATVFEYENDSRVEIDTRALGNNATCFINATAWLTNGSIMSITFSDVFIGNFFVPKVTVISPNGGETWTGVNTITWVASDVNAGESLSFDVFLSSDLGKTYVPLVQGISDTHYDWNSAGFIERETYLIKIRVTDGIYFSSDISDGPFTAGNVTTGGTTTTSPPTTTTSTESEIEPRVIAFIVILIISSIIMALIVYYAAKKWF